MTTATALIDGAIATLDGVKSAVTGTGKLVADIAAVYRQLFDARTECLRLQGENIDLKTLVFELKQALTREDAFDGEKEKYQLQEIGPRSFAYALKPDAGDKQPPHLLCVPCFQDRKVSLLQLHQRDFNVDRLKCPRCGAEVQTPNDVHATVMTAPRRRPFEDF